MMCKKPQLAILSQQCGLLYTEYIHYSGSLHSFYADTPLYSLIAELSRWYVLYEYV